MWYGFYELNFKTNDELKQFFKDSIDLCFEFRIDIKNESYIREKAVGLTLSYMLDNTNLKNLNVCVDRVVYNEGKIYDNQLGEIGYCTFDRDRDIFLWIYLSVENLNLLVEQYKLKKNE
jgi:hypothetical protein